MPIYEYECKTCNKVSEVIQKFSDPPLTTCETCGSAVQKLISRSAFHLKGSGWYATDYKKSASSATSTSAAASDSTKAASSSEGACATDSKPCGGGACSSS